MPTVKQIQPYVKWMQLLFMMVPMLEVHFCVKSAEAKGILALLALAITCLSCLRLASMTALQDFQHLFEKVKYNLGNNQDILFILLLDFCTSFKERKGFTRTQAVKPWLKIYRKIFSFPQLGCNMF